MHAQLVIDRASGEEPFHFLRLFVGCRAMGAVCVANVSTHASPSGGILLQSVASVTSGCVSGLNPPSLVFLTTGHPLRRTVAASLQVSHRELPFDNLEPGALLCDTAALTLHNEHTISSATAQMLLILPRLLDIKHIQIYFGCGNQHTTLHTTREPSHRTVITAVVPTAWSASKYIKAADIPRSVSQPKTDLHGEIVSASRLTNSCLLTVLVDPCLRWRRRKSEAPRQLHKKGQRNQRSATETPRLARPASLETLTPAKTPKNTTRPGGYSLSSFLHALPFFDPATRARSKYVRAGEKHAKTY